MIDAEIFWKGRRFFITGIYGNPVQGQRQQLWQDLLQKGFNRRLPWLLTGDFNELTGPEDKRGGKPRTESSFYPFVSFIDKCGLQEPPYMGNSLSWFGRRGSELVHCKLDRTLCNSEWFNVLPRSYTQYMPRIGSDHSPICCFLDGERPKRAKRFRYDLRWKGKAGFKQAVQRGWTSGDCDYTLESFQPDIVQKIHDCRRSMALWKRSQQSNSKERIQELKSQIDQLTYDGRMDLDELHSLQQELRLAYKDEEIFWRVLSRVQWLQAGDCNTSFFHAQTKERRAWNRINMIINEETNQPAFKENEMGEVIVRHFTKLYTSELKDSSRVRLSPMFSSVTPSISEEQNASLIAEVSPNEVKAAVFGLNPSKCPGPDGLSGAFFQDNWEVVGDDVYNMVSEFMTSGTLDSRVNYTSICLIPKIRRPQKVGDFRPISLCNFLYKVISKVLSSRLKRLIPHLISDNQAAFVHGRLISDNILIAHELLHAMRTKKEVASNHLAIKTDMMKAFDRMEWQFIEDTLRGLGFGETWTNRIMTCISSPTYEVLINGKPYGKITPSRGLRQGDPLSPFLFILCAEMLGKRLTLAEQEGQIEGIRLATPCPRVTHLFFADDSLFFCKAQKEQVETIIKILSDYSEASGQRINLRKSSITSGLQVPMERALEIKSITGITNEGGKGIYLGLPESFHGSKLSNMKFIERRVDRALNSWKSRYLSLSGKEVLIKAVVQALPAYTMSCFMLPKGTCRAIDTAISRFWWRNQNTDKGIHWCKWSELCKSKKNGGLGFRIFEGFNKALIGKQIWRIANNPTSLLARVMKGRYFRNGSIISAPLGSRPSYAWRSICQVQPLMRKGMQRNLGNGTSIKFLEDPWVVDSFSQPRPPVLKEGYDQGMVSFAHFIGANSDEWNLLRLKEAFSEEECNLICRVRPSRAETRHPYSWIHHREGKYSVKSGYQVWYHNLHSGNQPQEVRNPNLDLIYEGIWQVRAAPKIKHLLWRILSNNLPTNDNLSRRKMMPTVECPRCGHDNEDNNHIFFTCPYARAVWASSEAWFLFAPHAASSVYSNVATCLWGKRNGLDLSFWPWVIWRIWKQRNEFLFEGKDYEPAQSSAKARSDAQEWTTSMDTLGQPLVPQQNQPDVSKGNRQSPRNLVKRWQRPESGNLTCNIDGSWTQNSSGVGIAWIIRNEFGQARLFGAKVYPHLPSPIHVEAAALCWASRCLSNMGLTNVSFQTDCLNLSKVLKEPENWPSLDGYLSELHLTFQANPTFTIKVIGREANKAADAISKFVTSYPLYHASIDNVLPSWLVPIVNDDMHVAP